MTRWVRSGSSQKHKKMPGDATKWGEFDNQRIVQAPAHKKHVMKSELNCKRSLNSSSKSNFVSSKIPDLSEHSENSSDKLETAVSFEMKKSNKKNQLESGSSNNTSHNQVPSHLKCDVELSNTADRVFSPKKSSTQYDKFCKNNKNNWREDTKNTNDEGIARNSSINEKGIDIRLENNSFNDIDEKTSSTSQESIANNFEKTFTSLSDISYEKKRSKKRKKQNNIEIDSKISFVDGKTVQTSAKNFEKNTSNEICASEQFSDLVQNIKLNDSFDNTSNSKKSPTQESDRYAKKQKYERMKIEKKMTDGLENLNTDKTIEHNASPTKLKNKKEMYLKKLQQKRDKLGILLLPPNIERKLYNIRRALKRKGIPPEKQKEIMRQERRKEELKFQKIFNPSKLCFHCRKAGHLFADCPQKSTLLNQETGICFKCGSVEHISFKCPKKVQGFPFANCFICKEQGHISRDCPKNQRGVYPKGGRCNLCGNVNHLKKDCPSLKKIKNDEPDFTLHTMNEDTSIDADIIEKEAAKKKVEKKPKIVTF